MADFSEEQGRGEKSKANSIDDYDPFLLQGAMIQALEFL